MGGLYISVPHGMGHTSQAVLGGLAGLSALRTITTPLPACPEWAGSTRRVGGVGAAHALDQLLNGSPLLVGHVHAVAPPWRLGRLPAAACPVPAPGPGPMPPGGEQRRLAVLFQPDLLGARRTCPSVA